MYFTSILHFLSILSSKAGQDQRREKRRSCVHLSIKKASKSKGREVNFIYLPGEQMLPVLQCPCVHLFVAAQFLSYTLITNPCENKLQNIIILRLIQVGTLPSEQIFDLFRNILKFQVQTQNYQTRICVVGLKVLLLTLKWCFAVAVKEFFG